jgi:hypothetical protein
MLGHGYELLYEGEVLKFTSKNFELGRVDFLPARRKHTLAMLNRAKKEPVLGGKFEIKVLRAEDQVGLKVQASSNDPKRLHRDMADVRMLLENNYPDLDLALVREYFSLFGRGRLKARLNPPLMISSIFWMECRKSFQSSKYLPV